MAYQYIDQLPGEAKNRYEEKLRVVRLEIFQYELQKVYGLTAQAYDHQWNIRKFANI